MTLSGMKALPETTVTVTSLPLPDSLATITTDTGAFAPGHRDFARYDTPGLCLAAAHWANRVLERTLAAQALHDTVYHSASQLIQPAGVSAVAKACYADQKRVAMTGRQTGDLPTRVALALMAQDDSLAHALATRWIALGSTLAAQNAIRLQLIEGYYMDVEPTRMDAIDHLVTELDAQGQPADFRSHAGSGCHPHVY